MTWIGRSHQRIDAAGKVTGVTPFPGDINLPNQAYMKILFADRPHAIVREIDTSQAEAVPGVIAVLTARDVPVNEYGLGTRDQPVLCGTGSDKPYTDRVRFIGDQVALVVAESERIAQRALKQINVVYEDLPIQTDPRSAMAEDAFLIHPDRDSNVFKQLRIRKGNVEQAFLEADVIVEETYHTPTQEHAYLQPEAGISYIDDEGRVTVEVAGQWVHEDQEQIAHALNLPLDQVRVIYPAIGGAFGGREDMSIQIVLALASWRLSQRGIDRPVKIVWSREESILGHHKRHPFFIRAKWGATRDGKLIAAQAEVIQDGGAYDYTSTKVLGNATLMVTGPYDVPNVKVDAYSVYTNHIPGGAFRGFGGPQAAFVAENQINRLAQRLSIDPVEIRARNLLTDGVSLPVGTPLPEGVSIKQVVEACARRAGWQSSDQGWRREKQTAQPEAGQTRLQRGIGIACGFKNIGFSFGAPEQCTAILEIQGGSEIEKVILRHAGADVGQGNHTVVAQMAAEAVGVEVEKVQLLVSDTARTENSGSASASRLTFMSGNAIRGAAKAALAKWHDEERPAIATYTYHPPRTTPYDPETGQCMPNFAYGYVAEAAQVEVDLETGQIRLIDVICADDVGKAINPNQVQGQIEGCVVQAAGYTLLEDFQYAGGIVQTPHLSTYLIPTVLDIPDHVESILVETADPHGPWGARGMAEMPFIPLAPAVVAAVYDAVGVWFNEFPLTPERVLKGLREAGFRPS